MLPLLLGTAQAEETPASASSTAPAQPAADDPTPTANPSPQARSVPSTVAAGPRWNLAADPEAYSIVGAASGISLHKPMYLEPYTYSPSYNGRHTEAVFQISLKFKIFTYPNDGAFYAAYTQKSFWDVYDGADSRPFRETNYNPEAFYRYIPHDADTWHHLGIDVGVEHNSNGRGIPGSRSWNRVYIAPFQAEGRHLVYFKVWYRLPEDESKPRTDPARDDNPDIQDYYGYTQLDFEQQFFGNQLAHVMVRYNPRTGRGAVDFNYSIPAPGNHFFWGLFFFNGYGDSLIDYNHSITRVGLGVMLTR